MEVVWVIFLLVLIALVGALVFFGWLVVAFVRLVARALGGGRDAEPTPLAHRARCRHAGCRAENPHAARFCRRCGRPIAGREVVVVRRVAMW
jgi:hypothetical protein